MKFKKNIISCFALLTIINTRTDDYFTKLTLVMIYKVTICLINVQLNMPWSRIGRVYFLCNAVYNKVVMAVVDSWT